MTWINTISYEEATGKVKQLYERIKGPDNNIDNIMMAHSLGPHTMEGHMAIYKNVLHNSKNTLPKWLLEALGVYVSIINRCDYCIEHHFAGMNRLLNDAQRSNKIRDALESNNLEEVFVNQDLAAMRYARKLTKTPEKISSQDIESMHKLGLSDGEILEVNQVVSYFNYANRMVLGLGINKEGDIIGLSPNDSGNIDNWSHQ